MSLTNSWTSLTEKIPWTPISWIVLIAVIVAIVTDIYVQYLPVLSPILTIPTPSLIKTKEGFYGGAVRGTGHPDCLRDLQEGAEVLSYVMAAQGTDDYEEFQLILSKLGCLKKDLLSPSGIVQATLYQPYATSHDREPVGEVAGSCLNRTIPKRDLDIIFKTWLDRGLVLLKRLCTLTGMSEAQVQKSEALFTSAHSDVYNIATGRCLITPAEQYAEAHDAQPFEDPYLSDLREYKGYFSGFSGAV
jgi:hypothetical protein